MSSIASYCFILYVVLMFIIYHPAGFIAVKSRLLTEQRQVLNRREVSSHQQSWASQTSLLSDHLQWLWYYMYFKFQDRLSTDYFARMFCLFLIVCFSCTEFDLRCECENGLIDLFYIFKCFPKSLNGYGVTTIFLKLQNHFMIMNVFFR